MPVLPRINPRRAENLEQSNLEIAIHEDTDDIYGRDFLNPTYVAKAKILNDAFAEIGMGRYQVSPLTLSQRAT